MCEYNSSATADANPTNHHKAMKTETALAAAAQLEVATAQLHAIAENKLIPNAFAGLWENEPAEIAPSAQSIKLAINNALTLIG
jgi:hypothetical protein